MNRLLWRALPLLIWVTAVGALGAQLTVRAAIVSGVMGCAAAFWLGGRLAASKVRLWVAWACLLPGQVLVMALARAVRDTDLAAAMMGPQRAYVLSSVLLWFGSTTLWVGVLQASSRRFRPFVALEAAAVTVVGASIFAQHREGFINRPFFLVDPLWAKGYDPLPIFLAIGGAVAAVLVVLLASKGAAITRRATTFDVVLLMGLMLALYLVFPTTQIQKLRDLHASTQDQGKRGDATGSPTPADGGRGGGSPSPSPSAAGGQGSGNASNGGSGTELRDDDFSKKKSSSQSAQPVAVVLLRDDYTPPDGFYYFRQTVFSTFNGQRVVRDDGRFDRDVSDAFPTDAAVDLSTPAIPSQVGRRLDTTVALISTHTRPFGLVSPTRFAPATNPDPSHFQRAYDVASNVLTVGIASLLDHEVGNKTWNKETWKHYLDAPSDPRYQALAETAMQMLRPALREKPLARAVAVKLWLDKNGTYDITSKYEKSQDPVGDFLFGDRVGYCVSFAHAAVALYRTVGVPARVGTGYAVDARFRGNSSALLIRSNASHAWPEIYLDGVGWVPLDIAPEKSLVKPAEPPDSGQQDMYGDLARKQGEKQAPDKAPAHQRNLQELVRGWVGSVARAVSAALLLLSAGLYAVKVWRRFEPRFVSEAALPRIAYRSALDVLADHGALRRFGQSREEFARTLAPRCPSLTALTRLHLQHTLGRGASRVQRDDILALHRAICTEIARASSPTQRLTALLHPLGWWFVR